MSDETIQPTRIDKDEYMKFKQFVAETYGGERGHLSTEIENALREYRTPDNTAEPLQRIEDDIATIKAQLAEVESDGGTDATTPPAPSDDSHTHTDTKPSPKAPRAQKIPWIVEHKLNGGSSTPEDMIKIVSREFGVERRTAKKYVQPLIDELGAKRHPNNPDLLVWGDRLEQLENADL